MPVRCSHQRNGWYTCLRQPMIAVQSSLAYQPRRQSRSRSTRTRPRSRGTAPCIRASQSNAYSPHQGGPRSGREKFTKMAGWRPSGASSTAAESKTFVATNAATHGPTVSLGTSASTTDHSLDRPNVPTCCTPPGRAGGTMMGFGVKSGHCHNASACSSGQTMGGRNAVVLAVATRRMGFSIPAPQGTLGPERSRRPLASPLGSVGPSAADPATRWRPLPPRPP